MTTNNPEKAIRRIQLARLYLSRVQTTGDIKKIRFGINVLRHSINWLDDAFNAVAKTDSEDVGLINTAAELKRLAINELAGARKKLLSTYKLIDGGVK